MIIFLLMVSCESAREMQGLKCFSLCLDVSGKRKAEEMMNSGDEAFEEERDVDRMLDCSSSKNRGGLGRRQDEEDFGSAVGESGSGKGGW